MTQPNKNNWRRVPITSCACGCGEPVAKKFKKGHGRRRPVADRLLEKVERVGDCWVFTGAIAPTGYGRIGIGSKVYQAHRIAYEAFVGPIPEGLHIDHVRDRGCTHRQCVNPAHLEAVTQAENNRRANKLRDYSAGKQSPKTDCDCPVDHTI